MTLTPAQLGFLRIVGGLLFWGALTALLNFLSNATNLSGVLDPYLAGLVAAFAGAAEQDLASKNQGTAMFGAVSLK